jgi:hypothetical protein
MSPVSTTHRSGELWDRPSCTSGRCCDTADFLRDGRIIGVGATVEGPSGAAGLSQIQVALNWFEELKGRVGGRR